MLGNERSNSRAAAFSFTVRESNSRVPFVHPLLTKIHQVVFLGSPASTAVPRVGPCPGGAGQEALSTFDSADQIRAALQGNVVVSVLPNNVYLLIPSPSSPRNPAQVTACRGSLPREEEEDGALMQN